jgi:hypothetical protein
MQQVSDGLRSLEERKKDSQELERGAVFVNP